MEKILFSPLGDTDPVRGCYDGAMLHILRHYKAVRVVLFYTQDMEEKERRDHRYTRAIQRVAPHCAIEEIFTGIRDAHLYESFSKVLPQEVLRLREAYPEHTLLLNLSSGTPQMKTVLAMLAADTEGCVGVQVSSPTRRSNRRNEATQDAEDIDALLENNFDDEEGAENRCEEPPLGIFRYYAERSRIRALIRTYEYQSALMLAEQSPLVPEQAKVLLRHAAKRAALLPADAREILSTYQGNELFFFKGYKEESLVEYFLVMQIDQENGHLSSFTLRMIPFLYEFLSEYVRKYARQTLTAVCEKGRKGGVYLVREKLKTIMPEFLTYLDNEYYPQYRDQPLSFLLLDHYCLYMQKKNLAKDANLHTALLDDLKKIRNVRTLRNDLAHEITNVTEERFRERMEMGSEQMLHIFIHMLCLVYGKNINQIRDLYHTMNGWIEEALEIHE